MSHHSLYSVFWVSELIEGEQGQTHIIIVVTSYAAKARESDLYETHAHES